MIIYIILYYIILYYIILYYIILYYIILYYIILYDTLCYILTNEWYRINSWKKCISVKKKVKFVNTELKSI